MTYQTVSTAAHSFRVENVEWKVHGAHGHVQYKPPESTSVVRKLVIVTFLFLRQDLM